MSLSVKFNGEEFQVNEKGETQYTYSYTVVSTDLDATESSVYLSLPYTWGVTHPHDNLARVVDISGTQQSDDKKVWEVRVRFSTASFMTDRGGRSPGTTGTAPTQGTGGNNTSPEDRPWVQKWGAREREELLQKDRSDTPKPVVNSAGQPFDPPISVTASTSTLTITLFKTSIDPDKIRAYLNTVNDGDFLGWPQDCVKCVRYEQTSVYEHNAWFWQIDLGFEMKGIGFNPVKVLNAGTMYRLSNIKPLVPILDRHGNPITTPVPLKADGSGPLNAEDTPNYISFQGYYRTNFANIV